MLGWVATIVLSSHFQTINTFEPNRYQILEQVTIRYQAIKKILKKEPCSGVMHSVELISRP